jgi:predicted metal-binding membrane protein
MRSRASSASRTELSLAVAAALAWIALAAAGRHADHHVLESPTVAAVAGVLVGWLLMVVAMMLPASAPLMGLFRAMTASRADAPLLLAAMIGGYLLVWIDVGAALVGGDAVLHRTVDAWPWLSAHRWLIASGTLALAASYELSPLKQRCLHACRSPRMFLSTRWRSGGTRDAWFLGVAHGAFCVGCCWALMMVMFALSAGVVWAMAPFAAITAAERTAPWGARLRLPVAALLLGAAAIVPAAGLAVHT